LQAEAKPTCQQPENARPHHLHSTELQAFIGAAGFYEVRRDGKTFFHYFQQ
jgi:hypothetical protein